MSHPKLFLLVKGLVADVCRRGYSAFAAARWAKAHRRFVAVERYYWLRAFGSEDRVLCLPLFLAQVVLCRLRDLVAMLSLSLASMIMMAVVSGASSGGTKQTRGSNFSADAF